MPARLTERVTRFRERGDEPVRPRHAATVVLLRETTALEAYLLRRVGTMAVAPGAHVFPGGSVDRRDLDHAPLWAGPSPEQWAGRLRVDVPLARALVCAAVRETFEESGVLLAGPSQDTVVADTTDADWEVDRRALLDRSLSLAEFLQRRRLVLRSDLLRAWAHWITPEFEPRRYNTYFFVAALPDGQRTRPVGGEADRVAWLRPDVALDAYRRGELRLMFPTSVTLAELSELEDVAGVLEAGARRDLDPQLPRAVLTDDGGFLALPGDPEYPS
ncbi:MAG: NUDIX hydrolase [Streptosporangiales bacterium]|nr:NUDIX hydrolase [Streptosporangiales bacterium]